MSTVPPPPKMPRLTSFLTLPPLPPNCKAKDLGKGLYALLSEEINVDVDLVVIPGDGKPETMVRAHTIVLGATSPFVATMLTCRWSGDESVKKLELPEGIDLPAVNLFLVYLYTEGFHGLLKNLDNEEQLDIYLQLLSLANYFGVVSLLAYCDNKLRLSVNDHNAVKIYEKTRLFEGVKIGKTSWKHITRALRTVEGSEAWEASTWLSLLNTDYLRKIKEIDLFKGLLAWRNYNIGQRSDAFTNLLNFIRFSLIGKEDFVLAVSSVVLNENELSELYRYFEEKISIPCNPRAVGWPKTSAEFCQHLEQTVAGDIIELEGEYIGNFELGRPSVTIRGKPGVGAKIIAENGVALKIISSFCTLQGITVVHKSQELGTVGILIERGSEKNILKNVKVVGGGMGVEVKGTTNEFEDLTVNDSKTRYLNLAGGFNKISNYQASSSLTPVSDSFGVYIQRDSAFNKLSGIRLSNLMNGVSIKAGYENIVEDVEFIIRAGAEACDFTFNGIKNITGQKNTFRRISCVGLRPGDYAVYLESANENKVSDSEGGIVRISGTKIELTNVDASEKLQFNGKGHKFTNCKADTLLRVGRWKSEEIDCEFTHQAFQK